MSNFLGMGLLIVRLSFTIFLLFVVANATRDQELKTYTHSYSSFFKNQSQNFEFEGDSSIRLNALRMTPDTANPRVYNISNKSGRILLKRTFNLWDSHDTRLASFNTSFLVTIFREDNNATGGVGLAFIIAPSLNLPPNSYGEFLVLTNAAATTDSQPTNHLVLNINSTHGAQLAPSGGTPLFHNVWVNYDGNKRIVRVYMAKQDGLHNETPAMPRTPLIERDLDLTQMVARKSYFGFSASTGSSSDLHYVFRWNLTIEYFSEYFPGKKDHLVRVALGVGIPVGVILLATVAALGYYTYNTRKVAKLESNILRRLRALPGMPREFKFKELKKATHNFDESRKLGQGGYGVVYKGLLPNNLQVAVKWFSRESLKGENDFLAELTIINRLRHKHLVRLLGWCHKKGKLLLVYEYMPKGSLDMHLFNSKSSIPLTWILRYKIISGVASALNYLHNEYNEKVVHRDIKASNIMLDSDFNAYLGDFGLARALENEKTSYAAAEGILGTVGYIAPECFLTGKTTQDSDVYAFGAVLMEVVCGRRPGMRIGGFQHLVDWVWSLYREGCILDAVDQRLVNEYVADEVERLLLLGLACSHPIASERPKMQTIVQIISGSVPVPRVPPFKPAFVWPAMIPNGDFTETASIDTTKHLGSGLSLTPHFHSQETYSEYTDYSMV